MRYLLDSNIVIMAMTGLSPRLRENMALADEDELVTSSIVFAEVAYGSERGKLPSLQDLHRFAAKVPVLDFDYRAAQAYAKLPFKRASFDRLIAAHALSYDLTVVTENVRPFTDVPDLQVENWTE
jgi:tRNA(fMet)-specific endonuclease VapC